MLAKLAIKSISVYQLTLSLLIGNQCRFFPSCSHYTQEAIELHGVLKGCCLGGKRILRCHPWHEGGFDPVPGSQIHSDVETSINQK
ncbi:MAG: membrane protein insertion efficiency factor YidD [Pseudohongiella sp.]|nr:membrane protein insertion efficiency factor YidD [Pseudohongiella sp.]MDP2379457.1 membrane protein insertion efficiency factor YidD [Pseudohongiella sp.]